MSAGQHVESRERVSFSSDQTFVILSTAAILKQVQFSFVTLIISTLTDDLGKCELFSMQYILIILVITL